MKLALELLLAWHGYLALLVVPALLFHPELWIDLFAPSVPRRRRRRRHVRRPLPSSLLPNSGALAPGVGSMPLSGLVGGAVAVFLNSQLGGPHGTQ